MKKLCIFKKCVKNEWTVDIFPKKYTDLNMGNSFMDYGQIFWMSRFAYY